MPRASKAKPASVRYIQLTEFMQNMEADSGKNVKHEIDSFNRRLSDSDVFCKYCGAHGAEWIIQRGSRDDKQKGRVQRFGCKRCGRRLSLEGWGNYPLGVVEAVLDMAVDGMEFSKIAVKVSKLKSIKITRQTVSNIIERCVAHAIKYEEKQRPKCGFHEWQIDDTPQPFAISSEIKSAQPKRGKRDFWWITSVADVDGYWPASHVSKERNAKASERAVQIAVQRASGAPVQWKCDGYYGHIKGIRNVLRHANILSRTKDEDPGYINFIEGAIHSLMRGKAIKKRRKFRSLKTLQTLVDLVRIWHNFLHRLDSLGGITPVAKVGIAPVFRSWGEFVEYVFRRV
jgi:transposase-like protein